MGYVNSLEGNTGNSRVMVKHSKNLGGGFGDILFIMFIPNLWKYSNLTVAYIFLVWVGTQPPTRNRNQNITHVSVNQVFFC